MVHMYVRTYIYIQCTSECTHTLLQINECVVAESELSGLAPGRVCNAYSGGEHPH